MLRIKKLLINRAVCFIIILFIPWTASADTNIFLRMNPIQGESTDSDHKDWIDVSSVAFDVMQPNSGSGGTAGVATERAEFGSIKILKKVDSATSGLFIATAQGRHFNKAEIDFVNDATNVIVFKIILENVIVQSLGSTSTNDGLEEIVSLIYGVITLEYTKINNDGSANSIDSVSWDLEQNNTVVTESEINR